MVNLSHSGNNLGGTHVNGVIWMILPSQIDLTELRVGLVIEHTCMLDICIGSNTS